MTTHVTPIITGLAFAEAPRWRADPTAPGGGELWFSDFFTRCVMRIDGEGRAHTVVEVPQPAVRIGLAADGRLLVVSMLDPQADAAGRDRIGKWRRICPASPRFRATTWWWMPAVVPISAISASTSLCVQWSPTSRAGAMVAPDGKVSGRSGRCAVPQWRRDHAGWVHHDSAETFGRRLTAFDIAVTARWPTVGCGLTSTTSHPMASASTPKARCGWPRRAATSSCACCRAGASRNGLPVRSRASPVHGRRRWSHAVHGVRSCGRTPRVWPERTGRIDAVRVDVPAAAPPRCCDGFPVNIF